MDDINRKKGRPKGSGRDNGYKLHKMTKAEVEVFIRESTKIIFTKHLSYNEYMEWCRKQGVSIEMGNVYWKRVWNNVKEKFRHERDKLIDKHLVSYWDLYDRAINEGDLTNARQTLDALSKLMGLNEPDKIDNKSEVKISFNFGTNEDK